VLYLHGGGYVNEMLRWHWYLLARLTRSVPARFVVPMYPVAPRGAAADVVPAVTDLLADLVTRARAGKAGAARVVLMGDSAGGGLALAAAQVARDRGAPQPDRIVLVSPWLDVTMTDPDQPALAVKDRILAVPGLAEAGRRWAGTLDPADPLASPLYGDLTGLTPLTVLCGTHDVLLPDSRRLAARATATGLEIDYHEAAGLPHGYPLFPIPEARAARTILAAALRGPDRDR
jgi:acetyl esterase/lipase